MMTRRSLPSLLARSTAFLAVSGALAGNGCARNEVVVGVDLLSFVDAEEQAGPYVAPPGLITPPDAIEPQAITLPEGLAGVIAIERVDLSFAIEFTGDPQSGDGEVEVRLYIAAGDSTQGGSDVYQTAPIHTGTTALGGGTTTTHIGTVVATEENGLIDIFESGELLFGLALVYDATGSPVPVFGQWTIRKIDGTVTGTGDVF
jgi:hypothetical protein